MGLIHKVAVLTTLAVLLVPSLPFSAAYAAVSSATVKLSEYMAGAPADYSIVFQISEGLPRASGYIDIEFPHGTLVGAFTDNDIAISATSGIGTTAFAGTGIQVTNVATITSTRVRLGIGDAPNDIGPGATLQVKFVNGRVVNPSAPGEYVLMVNTSEDVNQVKSDVYIIVMRGWRAMDSGTATDLRGVCGSSSSDIFAVGENGTTVYYDGESWRLVGSGTTDILRGVWYSSSGFIAGGWKGTVIHYNGSGWNRVNSGTTYDMYNVGGTAIDTYVVGSDNHIVHYDGRDWRLENTQTPAHLYSIWASSATDVFAVGYGGTIIHYDGTGWTQMDSGTTTPLHGIWGSSASDVFAVGGDGTILHYNGSTWNQVTSGAKILLRAVWGRSSSDVFAVGGEGTILHYDGNIWSPMDSGTGIALWAIWGNSTDIFVVGNNGTILHYALPAELLPTQEPAGEHIGAPILLTPSQGDKHAAVKPTFAWTSVDSSDSYEFVLAEEIGLDDKFAIIDYSATTDINEHVAREPLKYNTTYNWRVRAVRNGDTGAWVTLFFTTMQEPAEETSPSIGPSNFMTYLGMNVQEPPFDDVRIRKAVYLSLDRDDLKIMAEEVYNQNVAKVVSIVTPSVPNLYIDRDRDIEMAKRLRVEAGYPNGFKISLHVLSSLMDIAQKIATDLKESLIDVEIRSWNMDDDIEVNTFKAGCRTGKWDFFLADAAVDEHDTPQLLERLLSSNGIEIYTGYSNSAFDELVDSGSFRDAENLAFGADGGFPPVLPLFWHGTTIFFEETGQASPEEIPSTSESTSTRIIEEATAVDSEVQQALTSESNSAPSVNSWILAGVAIPTITTIIVLFVRFKRKRLLREMAKAELIAMIDEALGDEEE